MLRKFVKCALIFGGILLGATFVPSCYKAYKYSGLKPAEGFPAWERARNLKVKYVKKDNKLKTYLQDGTTLIPIYERHGHLIVGDPREECKLYTLEEKIACLKAFGSEEEKQETSKESKGFGYWVGEKLKSGEEILEKFLEDIKGGYSKNEHLR